MLRGGCVIAGSVQTVSQMDYENTGCCHVRPLLSSHFQLQHLQKASQTTSKVVFTLAWFSPADPEPRGVYPIGAVCLGWCEHMKQAVSGCCQVNSGEIISGFRLQVEMYELVFF